jgi:hypothetical protein
MLRLRLALPLLALLLLPALLPAQEAHFGLLLGPSFVGGGDSRTIASTAQGSLTGADQSGLNVRLFVDFPLQARGLTLRMDAFYNRLTSADNTASIVGPVSATAAATDRTVGAVGSLLIQPAPNHRLSPYFAGGLGFFHTTLTGHFVQDPSIPPAKATAGGMGLGIVGGIGLTCRLGRSTALVLDWRYHQGLHNQRGSAFMPLTFGFRF